MAEFPDSETCLWFKTRSSQLSEIDDYQPILEEQHSLSLSPERQPPATVSSAKEKRESESGLCSSSEPEIVVIKENQGTEEDELVFANGVVLNMKCDEEDGSQFVSEKEKDSKKFDAGFSGNRESGENHIGAEDCKEVLGTSCVTFDGNESEKNQESIAYALTHVSDFTDLKSEREIMDDNIKIEEGFVSSSCVVDEISPAGGKGNTYEEMHKMEGSNGETRKCALKIEVIDETAVIDTTCGSKVGNGIVKGKGVVGCEHSEWNVDKNVMKHETDGKREKRSRRKAKGAKKLLGRNGKENILTHMGEVQNGCQKRGYGAKRAYSRLEMEDVRFVNLDAQRKKWIEVYCGLGPTVAREYDDLIDSNNQKHIHIDFDPRNQFGKKEKKTQLGILGEDSLQTMDDKIENMNPLDPAFGIRASGEDGDTGVGGGCSEDDDSDDDYSSIQRPAFVVTGDPDFDSGPPQDGLEYLRRVRISRRGRRLVEVLSVVAFTTLPMARHLILLLFNPPCQPTSIIVLIARQPQMTVSVM